MEITGKIILELPERGGTSARTGTEWKVKTFVLETFDQYPRKMVFEVFGIDRIASMNITVGESYTVAFDIDAREYNGRWYNTVRAFRVAPAQQGVAPAYNDPLAAQAPAQVMAAPAASAAHSPAASPIPTQETADDLPF